MDDPRKRAPFPRDRDLRQTSTPPQGSPAARAITNGVPREFLPRDEDLTGKYDGDELAAMRELREPLDRVAHLEEKHDKLLVDLGELTKSVSNLASSVEGLKGEMKIIPELVGALKDAAKAANDRASVTLNAQVAQVVAPLEAQRTKLGWVTKLLAIAGTAVAGVIAIIEAGRC